MKIYINGKFYSKNDAKISVFDHGLLYGDGVFEGIRLYNSCIFKLTEHIDRLYESAKTIRLEIPMTKKKMIEAVAETVRRNPMSNGYIRLIVTRGAGALGLNPFNCNRPQVIIIASTIRLYPEQIYKKGLEIITIPTHRNIPEAVNPRLKSLNYLNNVLAKIEAINSGYNEALMLNSEGFVAECTGENIFIVKKSVLKTPSIEMGILEGITRNTVIDIARGKGYPVEETVLTRHDLYNADECFITGTAAEVVPVIKVDGRIIGNGKPGKITLEIIKIFRKITEVDGYKIK